MDSKTLQEQLKVLANHPDTMKTLGKNAMGALIFAVVVLVARAAIEIVKRVEDVEGPKE